MLATQLRRITRRDVGLALWDNEDTVAGYMHCEKVDPTLDCGGTYVDALGSSITGCVPLHPCMLNSTYGDEDDPLSLGLELG